MTRDAISRDADQTADRPDAGPARPAGRRGSALAARLVLAALIAAACAGHWAWIVRDSVPLTTDAYNFMANLLRFHDGFPWGGDLERAWRALGRLSHGGRPPLVQLASWPVVALGGRGEDAFLLVDLVFLALLAVAVYRLARRVAGEWPAVVAAALILGYPPIVHLTRGYLPHFVAAIATAVSLDLLLGLLERRTPRRALAFGASLGLGMLVHPAFFWAMAVPAAAVGLWLVLAPAPGEAESGRPWRLGERLRDPLLRRGLVPGAAIAGLLAAPWYLTWGRKLTRLQVALQSEEVAALRGGRWRTVGYGDVEPSFGWYAFTAPEALSWLLLAPTLLGLALCLIRPRRSPGALVLALTLAGCYVLLALQPTLAWVYPPVVLPAAAALGAYGIAALRPRPLAATAGALTVAASAFVFAFVSSGWGRPAAVALGALEVSNQSCRFHRAFCAAPPRTAARPAAEVLAAVLDDPRCAGRPPCRLFAVYGSGLGPTLYRHALVERWPRRPLTIYAQHEATWGSKFPLRNLLESEYVVWVDPRRDPKPLPGQLYRALLTRMLRSPPTPWAASHEVVARFPLHGKVRLVLLRRTAPPDLEEAEAVAAELTALGIDRRQLSERDRLLDDLRPVGGATVPATP